MNIVIATIVMVQVVSADTTQQSEQTLIKNVQVFDGYSDKLSANTSVLIENNLIKEISATAKAGNDATVIDGGGRVLMPGLIEAHGHLALVTNPLDMANNRTFDYIGALMGEEAERYLMRGFTSLRDAGFWSQAGH
jgi:imidazolonepropionase-like amidohydrolase